MLDPWGELLAVGGPGEEIVTGEFDVARVHEVRSGFNVFHDRRPDLYRL